MKRLTVACGLMSVMCMLFGCLEFDGQEVRIRYDASTDELEVLLIYKGIHSTEADLSKALEQLGQIHAGHRTFAFLGSWPFSIALDTGEWMDDYRPLQEVLLESLSVETAPLWTDAQGKINGYQLIRAKNFAGILAAVNALFHKQLMTKAGLKDFADAWGIEDPPGLALLREAAKEGYAFVFREGSALGFSVPTTDDGAAAIRRAIMQKFTEPDLKEDERRMVVEMLSINDVSIIRKGDDLRFLLGNPQRPEVLVSSSPKARRTMHSLVDALVKRGWKLDPEGSMDKARRAFAEF